MWEGDPLTHGGPHPRWAALFPRQGILGWIGVETVGPKYKCTDSLPSALACGCLLKHFGGV